VALCARTDEQIQTVRKDIQATGGTAVAFVCDVGKQADVEEVCNKTREELGEIRILVNNAGESHSSKFLDTNLKTWHDVLNVNLWGSIYFTRAVLPEMLADDWGRIINVSSVAGLAGIKFGSAYSASKHAVMGLTRSLAFELADTGVAINAICPGWVDTQMLEASLQVTMNKTGRSRDAVLRAILSGSKQRRLVLPREIAEEVLRLIDEGISGQEVVMVGD
jgi:NAD(P)-dependent dehydrogenase (short-subunit alcohol dehydrogenase family)